MNLAVGKRLVLDKAPTPTPDFSVSPTSGSIAVGEDLTAIVTVKGGLDIASISVATSDATKATVSISGNTITVNAVAEGNAIITVSSSEVSKTVPINVTITAAPLNPSFTVAPTSGTVDVGETTDFTVTLTDGLQASTMRVGSSDTAKATVAISGTTITATGVASGSATITVSSTAISKTQDLAITVNEPSEATFKATDVSGDLIKFKMWASLNTTTGELTLDNPNGSNIILAGWVVDVDTTAKTANIRYLKANPANYQLNLDTGVTVAGGDPVILNGGIGSATGYTVPNCTYSSDAGYVNVAVTASDIATLEQHKVS